MRYWLTDYELARPRLENCWKAYLISSIIMANILKYITGGDNILKRQTAEEDNKTISKRFKGKRIFQNIHEKTLCRCNWRHLVADVYFVV